MQGDGNATLVIQKTCLLPRVIQMKDWLHISFFHSTCTIKYKVYNLIINSGMYENMVLVEATKKQLKKKHLRPYKLKWLNQDSIVIVDQHCLVLFFYR